MTLAYAHILVIDDNARRSARAVRPFALWGWQATRIAADLEVALSRASEADIDLAFVHIDAAEKDDYALFRAWKSDAFRAKIPIVVAASPGAALSRLEACVVAGASDYITHPQNTILLRARLQNSLQKKLLAEQAGMALEDFNEIEKVADDLRLVILPLAAALSAETNYDRLLERIVDEARTICRADGGILYLQDEALLSPAFVQISSLGLAYGGTTGTPPPLPPLSLTDAPHATLSLGDLAIEAALRGESTNIADIPQASADHEGRFDLTNLAALEKRYHYRVSSALVVPLRSGQVVGALFLMNCQEPVTGEIVAFDAYHQLVAESLASMAAVILNNRLLNERQLMLLRFKQELEIAREIQLSFLPRRIPQPPGWEVEARFQPALDVAGDFYDVVELPHGHIGLVIADVVGKGVTAALFMAIIRSLFRALFEQHYQPLADSPVPETRNPHAAVMTPFAFIDREALLGAVRMTNTYLAGTHQDAYIFATLFCALLDPASGRLLYVNAGHNPPYVLRRRRGGRSHDRLQPTGPAIGLLLGAEYRLGEIYLAHGDLLLAFTDGVPESRDPAGEELGIEAMETLFDLSESAAELLDAICERVDAHAEGAEAYDDVTMFAVRRLPGEPR